MRGAKMVTTTCLGRSQECFKTLKNPERCAYKVVRKGPIEEDWVVYEFTSRDFIKNMLVMQESASNNRTWFPVQKFGAPWTF